MGINSFDNISIRGRVAFVIMCFEKYVSVKYPERDWSRVSEMMWRICDNSDYIDNSANKYMEIIPEYLFETDNFAEAEFDYLSEEDFSYFVSIIPNDDQILNTIMHAAYSIAMEYAYVAIEKDAPDTREYIEDTLKALSDENITAPDIQLVSKYTFDESDGWGHSFDGRYLSSILK